MRANVIVKIYALDFLLAFTLPKFNTDIT